MTKLEQLEESLLEEQYDLDKASPKEYSYQAGWNTALERAFRVARSFVESEE